MLNAYSLAQELGDVKVSNMIMVGALVGSAAISLSLDEISAAVGVLSSGKVLQKNMVALRKGFDFTQTRQEDVRSTQAC